MSALKVVCLISGGKDSLFSILHCLSNGHEVVALSNLHPPYNAHQDAVDDLDSYMYQTIGHSIIPLFEKALGLPLYRQSIEGAAVNQDKCYAPSNSCQDDETEALIPLLRKVKLHHPEVNAVSTGAILSDYQRTRVESVAIRLGLTPLSYLWQYPSLPPHSQTSLLEDMAAAGQDSRIIKVASGGLDSSFLWQNVADPRTIARLDKASKCFGSADDGAVLGEGGEYETLAVAGPSPLWKGRIVVEENERQIITGDAGSASLQFLGAHLEMTEADPKKTLEVRTPPMLERPFQTIVESLQRPTTKNTTPTERPRNAREENIISKLEVNDCTLLPSITGEGSDASEQMRSIMERVKQDLQSSGHEFVDVVYTSIILHDMAEFPAINAAYSTYFEHPNPPARLTVACANALPHGKLLMVSFTVQNPSYRGSRRGLHVQSRSYWAPANIGPYSQAISVPCEGDSTSESGALVYVAGQIPLIPQSMELATSLMGGDFDTFLVQTVLALQHAVRIGRAVGVRQWSSAIAFIIADSQQTAVSRSNVAHQAWESLHEANDSGSDDFEVDGADRDSFDVWDIKHGPARNHSHGDHTHRQQRDAFISQTVPPLQVVRVDALPRGASIEWVTYGLTSDESKSLEIPHCDHLLSVFEACFVPDR